MLYLIRHAKTKVEPGRPPSQWDLDPEGLPKLHQMAAAHDWNAIPHWYSSTEPKAVQTARALTEHPVTQRGNLGEVRRGYTEHYESAVRLFLDRPELPPAPGWETAQQAQTRIVQALTEVQQQHPGRSVAVVSHGLVLMLYLSHLRRQDQVDLAEWRTVGFPDLAVIDGGRVVQPFGGISDMAR